jgi:UDP-glucose 4-epimerase
MKIMITGANGYFGKLLARRLRAEMKGVEIVGVDVRHESEVHGEMKFRAGDTRKKRIEDIFKVEGKIDVVIHLAFESGQPLTTSDELMLTNVYGTFHMLELAEKYGVSTFIYPSSTIVYGARPDNPAVIRESHPLLGNRDIPPIRDRIEADLICQTFARGGALKTRVVILRMVPIWRAGGSGILTSYMQNYFVPTPLGFDPMFMTMFDNEVLDAFMLALNNPDAQGTYNIRGKIFAPISEVIRKLGKTPVMLPEFLIHSQGRSLWANHVKFDYNYLKYTFAVDGARAKNELGYEPVK